MSVPFPAHIDAPTTSFPSSSNTTFQGHHGASIACDVYDPEKMAEKEAQTPNTAIVTGSARGIGKAIAIQLANDGYNVCINDIASNQSAIDSVVNEITASNHKAIGIAADVSKRSEVETLVNKATTALGPLYIMVANAGIAQVKPVLELTEQDVERMFSVNLYGVFNCYQVAAREFIAQGTPGKLIGAASIAAYKPFPLLPHYSASKYAVRGLTQAFATELAPHRITCNAYAPGIVDTHMWEEIDAGMGALSGAGKGETMAKYCGGILLGRVSVGEDVARVVGFLAGRGNDYMTGQTVVVDGGMQFA